MEWLKKILILSLLIFSSSCKLLKQTGRTALYQQMSLINKKICIIGDTGTGSSDQILVAKALEKESCSILFHTGDIIYPKGIRSTSSKKLQSHFLEPYKNILSSIPTYLVMGNHDHKKSVSIWTEVANGQPLLNYPSRFYYVNFEHTCVYFIDTVTNYRQGQERWIKKAINDNDCHRRVAIGHHPHTSSGQHGNARGFIKKFLNEHIINNVELYISGHDHQLSIEKISSSSLQLISGAGAKLRSTNANSKTITAISELGYAVLMLKDKGFQIQLMAVDSSAIATARYTYEK